jgi:hypothetical protein
MTAGQATDNQDKASRPEHLARWFLLAAVSSLRQENWQQLADSTLDAELEDALVAQFLADNAARRSLLTVLRDPRYLERLPTFGQQRDPARGMLADSTLAFKRARSLLERHQLLDSGPRETGESVGQSRQGSQAPESIVQRRAARRTAAFSGAAEVRPPAGNKAGVEQEQMSDEEYARLEEALSRPVQESSPPASGFGLNEERLSLLSGLLAGLLLFALVWWFLL